MDRLIQSDLLIAPSQFIKSRFVQSGIPPKKIHTIPHGLKMPVSKAPSRKRSSNAFRFAYVGAVHPLKGIEVLLKAFYQIDYGCTSLNIYGTGNRDYIAFLKKSVPKNKNVRFHGPIRHAMVSRVLRQNDVLIIPSLCLESFSIVAREAFYSGLPVIASNSGALPEAVTDGMDGLLFGAGDHSHLARQMSRLIKEGKLFEKLKSNLPPVKSIQCHADELISIYRRLSRG
jgi:glycosyltransferase involved in cell wall biosynthesis